MLHAVNDHLIAIRNFFMANLLETDDSSYIAYIF